VVFRDLFGRATQLIAVVDWVSEVGSHLLVFCWVAGMEFAYDLRSTEFGERGIELIVENITPLCRIDGVFDMWEDSVGTSDIYDGLGVVLSFLPVSHFGMALPGIAFWLRLFIGHDPVSVCSHDYLLHFVFPHGVVVFGQLKDVAVNAPEGFGRHCAGGWCIRDFGGLGKGGRMVYSRFWRPLYGWEDGVFEGLEVFVRAGGRRFRGSWC